MYSTHWWIYCFNWLHVASILIGQPHKRWKKREEEGERSLTHYIITASHLYYSISKRTKSIVFLLKATTSFGFAVYIYFFFLLLTLKWIKWPNKDVKILKLHLQFCWLFGKHWPITLQSSCYVDMATVLPTPSRHRAYDWFYYIITVLSLLFQ